MKTLAAVVLFLFSPLFALEDLPKASKDAGSYVSPVRPEHVIQIQASFFPKVNPITGEYVEEETDLLVAGCEPLHFRRFYGHMNRADGRYGGWRINPETAIVANLQWKKSGLFAAVGEENGSVTFLGECQNSQNLLCYGLDKQNSYGYTNLGEMDPHHTKLHFWPESGNEGKSRYLGFVQDGSGRKRTLFTNWHNWHGRVHHSLKPRKYYLNCNPENWIPYQLIVDKEILPNGNVIIYGNRKWQDEIHWPHPQLLSSITAYNHDLSKKLAEITISYSTYNWIFKAWIPHDKEKLDYEECVWEVAGYTVKGSDDRECAFYHTRRDKLSGPILLHTVHNLEGQTSYNYTDGCFYMNSVDRGGGRTFHTEFDANHRVSSQKGPYGTLARYVYHDGATVVYDAENHPTTYRYDSKKRIIAIEKGDSIERLSWDNDSRLTAKTLEDLSGTIHLKHSFTYDAEGNLTEETLKGAEESYTLYRTYEPNDPFHLKRSETDGFGKITYYSYKPGTNLLESEKVCSGDQLLYQTTYTYDDCAACIQKTVECDGYHHTTTITPKQSLPCFGLPEVVEETLLGKIAYTYHNSGQVATETHYDTSGNLCYTLQNTYDKRSRLISTKDPFGNETTYTYDNHNNVIDERGPKHHTTWEYDLENRPIKENRSGLEKTFAYDKLGRLIASTDECGHTTRFAYNAQGRVIRTEYPDGGIEHKEYDLFGNVTKEIDPNGHVTLKKYNIRNQPTHILYPDKAEEHFRYNPNGTLASHTDKQGVTTHYTYDLLNHVIKEENPDYTKTATWSPFCKLSETDEKGEVTRYTYDLIGRKISEKKGPSEIFYFYDGLGRESHIQKLDTQIFKEYDWLGRLIEERREDEQGRIVFQEKYAYDAYANKTDVITCQGVTQTTYNAHQLPIQVTDPADNLTTFTYTYTPAFTKTTQDPDGVLQIEIHDPCRRLKSTQILNPQGHIIQHREFDYDRAGNKIQATEHIYMGTTLSYTLTTRWEYGPGNRLEKLIESDLKETRYLYDSHGRLATVVKPDQTEIHRVYDSSGRLSNLHSNQLDYTYTYDKKGRITSVHDGHTTTTRTYDALDNLIEETLGNGYTLKYAYDPEGRLTQLILPDGIALFTYQADKLHQVTYKGHTTTYTRNLHGKPTLITLPSNLGAIHLEYDSCLRVKNLLSPYFTALEYRYDPTGHLTHYTYTDALGPVTTDFTYDDLHQLLSDNAHTYSCDSLNNRVTKNNLSHTLNTLSQIIHDGNTTYAYDLNGNLIQAGETTFAYDALDRLTHVHKEGKTYEYIYDPFNRRITKKTPTETIHYLWQGKNEIGSSKGELRILGDGLGAEIGAATLIQLNRQLYVPIHDQRGALVTLLDLKGNPLETIRYTAYGEELTSTFFSPWRFCSKRLDPETNYLYFGRRYYCPTLGRFISPDPRGFDDGPNLYAYAHNSPYFEIDLYGEWGQWLDRTRYWTSRFGKAALDFGFPCANALYNLPPNAPLWKRGALAFGTVGEAALIFAPPVKLGASLTEKTIFQITRSTAARSAERSLLRTAGKTSIIANERKIVQTAKIGEISNIKAAKPVTQFIEGVKVSSRGKVIAEGAVDLRPTLDRLNRGRTLSHHNDGSIFSNFEGLLPSQPAGYYREYVHPTPGINLPGPQRIVVGKGGEMYYTPDHYKTFIPIGG